MTRYLAETHVPPGPRCHFRAFFGHLSTLRSQGPSSSPLWGIEATLCPLLQASGQAWQGTGGTDAQSGLLVGGEPVACCHPLSLVPCLLLGTQLPKGPLSQRIHMCRRAEVAGVLCSPQLD